VTPPDATMKDLETQIARLIRRAIRGQCLMAISRFRAGILNAIPGHARSTSPPRERRLAPGRPGKRGPKAELVEFHGKTQTLDKWAADTGIALDTIYCRLKRGWPIERALTRPVRTKRAAIERP
jgi:hypothetical protein